MLKLDRLSIEEINKRSDYLSILDGIYSGDFSGEFFKYNFHGDERWLYRSEGYCTILCTEGDSIGYTSFYVDSDYTLGYMEFDKFCAGVDNDEIMVWNEESLIRESLRMVERSEFASKDGYTGVIVHHQRNDETKEDLIVSYQNQYRKDGHIYPCNLQRPFVVCFVKGNKVTRYLNFRTNRDYLSYDVITIKEYGLLEFLKNGSYALQGSHEINRYFKIKYQKSDGTCVILTPISVGYTEEEMQQMIKDKGFKVGVSQYVIDYFNGEYEEIEEYRELALALQQLDLEESKDKKLDKAGDSNGNNSL